MTLPREMSLPWGHRGVTHGSLYLAPGDRGDTPPLFSPLALLLGSPPHLGGSDMVYSESRRNDSLAYAYLFRDGHFKHLPHMKKR